MIIQVCMYIFDLIKLKIMFVTVTSSYLYSLLIGSFLVGRVQG